MPIQFSESTIKQSFLVQNPDWYNYKISKVITKRSSKGDSDNYIFVFDGLNGEMENVPVSKLINSKCDWILYPLFKAANGGVDLTPGVDVDPNSLVDIVLSCFTRRGSREDGTPMNDLTEFRPVEEAGSEEEG